MSQLDQPLVQLVADAIAHHLYLVADCHPRKWRIETQEGCRVLTSLAGEFDLREVALHVLQKLEARTGIELIEESRT